MMDSLSAMRVFIRVVEAGGLSAAGRIMGLAPSSVSRRIGELEEMLGVKLLHRTTRQLSLTDAGETYYARVGKIVAAVDEANLAVSEKRAEPSGTLRITAPASVARVHIAPAVAAFHQQHPAVSVVMTVTDRVVDIVAEGYDVAIRTGALEDSSLRARKVGEARRIVCASPDYLARVGSPKHPSDLADHACLTFRAYAGANLWRFGKGKAAVTVRATGPFFSDDGGTLVTAARAGLGVILLPEWLVGGELGQGRLVQLLPRHRPEPAVTPLHALYAPGAHVAPKIRAFVDFLVDRLRNYDWRAQR